MSLPKAQTQQLREAYGDTVRAWREARGYNRTEFAAELGIARQCLMHLETGRNDPTYATLLRLAQALDTTAWNLGRCIEMRLKDDKGFAAMASVASRRIPSMVRSEGLLTMGSPTFPGREV